MGSKRGACHFMIKERASRKLRQRGRPGRPPQAGVCLTSMGSEMNASRVLNFTAIISSRYAGALSHGAASNACVGIVLNERIRQIVELHSKFERNALGDRKVFDQGRV